MVITAAIVSKFEELIREANSGDRLQDATSWYQRESAMLPLYIRGKQEQVAAEDLELDTIQPLIAAIPADKREKYYVAIKYLEKLLLEQRSKIFWSLKKYGEKLSKSQQRYSNPVVGDAGHGLCMQMALMW